MSYSHADKVTARRFAGELEKRGAVVLFDHQTVQLGDRLSERISAAIRSSEPGGSDVEMTCLSFDSGRVGQEAHQECKFVVCRP